MEIEVGPVERAGARGAMTSVYCRDPTAASSRSRRTGPAEPAYARAGGAGTGLALGAQPAQDEPTALRRAAPLGVDADHACRRTTRSRTTSPAARFRAARSPSSSPTSRAPPDCCTPARRVRRRAGGAPSHAARRVRRARRREVHTEGDAFFVAFARATDAIAAAVAAQRALAAHPWPEGVDLRVRMGLHTGEAESARRLRRHGRPSRRAHLLGRPRRPGARLQRHARARRPRAGRRRRARRPRRASAQGPGPPRAALPGRRGRARSGVPAAALGGAGHRCRAPCRRPPTG